MHVLEQAQEQRVPLQPTLPTNEKLDTPGIPFFSRRRLKFIKDLVQ